jgi:hypothetical protein
MTAQCANSACAKPFRYFRSGKIYLIDAGAAAILRGGAGIRDMEYFWLCGECSATMHVTVDGNGAVIVERVAPVQKTRESPAETTPKVKRVATSVSA